MFPVKLISSSLVKKWHKNLEIIYQIDSVYGLY